MNQCLFATVLTCAAPSANYGGDAAGLSRRPIQKITDGRFEYPVFSPESMRNAIRELLRFYKLPSNRERLNNEDQLAVKFSEYPDPSRFADDFFFGYLLALNKKERTEAEKVRGKGYPVKRDSLLRMNLAKSLRPYRHDALMTQSPKNVDSPWQNAEGSALLQREMIDSAFQYPFAFNLADVFGDHLPGPNTGTRKQWFAAMLRAIAELTDVAGNHARSLFHMAPASIVIRLTGRMVPGYSSYGFQVDEKGAVSLAEVIDGIRNGDYPGEEFYLGGILVKQMSEADREALEAKGVHLFRMADQALAAVSKATTGIDFLGDK